MAVDAQVMAQLPTEIENRLDLEKLKHLAQKLLNDLECSESELSLLITTDDYIRKLNQQYREMDSATDVLSFAAREQAPAQVPIDILGDVVISLETASRQAEERDLTLAEEMLRLLIHGLLHLLGYDHEGVAEAEVQRMQNLEDSLFDRYVGQLTA